jgi:tRNA A-37 threonylcarbamoyl transferase component Bud32
VASRSLLGYKGWVSPLALGSVVAGYHIEAVIGRGGMGIVYRATHQALDRTVAVKAVAPELGEDEELRARFKRESKVAASIDHPNVVTVHDAREVDGMLLIVMQYVEGTDLDALLRREGRLDPPRAVAIVEQVASALDAAHDRDLVHRDVKPANVLIGEVGGRERAYLTDFGLGKFTTSLGRLTRTGMLVGTLDYLAPEQIQGAPVDRRCDVYSLGCVLYQMLTGRVPYDRDNDAAKMWAQVHDAPPVVSDVAPELRAFDDVVRRAMAKTLEQRFPTAGEVGHAATMAATEPTRAVVAEAPERTAPAARPPSGAREPAAGTPPERPGPRRRRWPYAAGAAAAAAVVAVIVLLAGGSGGDDPAPKPAAEGVARPADEPKREPDAAAGGREGLAVDDPVHPRTATSVGRRLRRARARDDLPLHEYSHKLHRPNGKHYGESYLARVERGQPANLGFYMASADVLGTTPRALGIDLPVRASAAEARRAGPRVFRARDRRGMTLDEFSERLHNPAGRHYPPRYVSGIERGTTRAPLYFYFAASEVLRVPPSDLLGTDFL